MAFFQGWALRVVPTVCTSLHLSDIHLPNISPVDPPQLVVPVTQRPPSMPNGPVIPISEYKQMSRGAEGATASPQASPEIEAMVQQVTAVMPHVPHNAIRQDLCESSLCVYISIFFTFTRNFTPSS